MKYLRTKADVVEYVGGMLPHLDKSSAWTMTIKQVLSGDYSVLTATDVSSDAIEWEQDQLAQAKFFSDTQVNT